MIIANNLNIEQEEKLLELLKKHKKEIGWILASLPRINPSICMHKILLEEDVRPVRQQQRRLNLTPFDVIKKEVTKLLEAGIIYPISDNLWVSPIQVGPKKFGMTVIKNRQDEMVLLNQATRKDYFLLLFVDQVLEKLVGYMQIHTTPEDQHKTTFTCPFRTFTYTRISFGLCNALSTFQRCMISIFSNLLEDYMEVFIDDFTVYVESFEACLDNLSKVLRRCIDSNLVLNFEKCHFMVTKGIILGHLVSARGIKVDKAKIDAISSLPNPASVWEQDRPASAQATMEGHQLRLRSALCECILGAEEKTHVHAHPPSTKLGTFVRANVRRLQPRARSSPRPTSQQAAARNCLCISNDGCSLSQLHNHRKGAFGNSHIYLAPKLCIKVPLEEAESKVETDLVDAASLRGHERREKCCSRPFEPVGERGRANNDPRRVPR
ncbi:Retrovirus-related Pol polyprotein from transposon opus, partial [Mucuna pruriens]